MIFRDGEKLTAVASVGRDVENLKAEVALERGDEFRTFVSSPLLGAAQAASRSGSYFVSMRFLFVIAK